MANSAFSSNLGDSDALAGYPSAASPLSIDDLLKARVIATPPAAWANGFPAPANASQPAAASTTPATPMPAAPQKPLLGALPTSGDTPQSMAMGGLRTLDTNLNQATQAASEIPTSSPHVDALNKELAAKSAPTQLRQNLAPGEAGTGTGPMLAQYKPSGWERFGRGVKGAAVGLLEHGIGGAALGAIEPQAVQGGTAYGAPNRAYQQAEQQRQEDVSQLGTSLQAAKDAFKNSLDAQKERATQYRANAALGKDEVTGASDIIKAQTTQQKNDAALREHGLKPDGQGGYQPISLEEMTPQERSMYELRAAQKDADDARAEMDRAKNDPNSAGYQLAAGRLRVAQQNAQTAIQRLGLSQQEFGFHQDEFYNPQPTASERGKGDLAQSAVERVREMRTILQKHPEFFGPAAGRGQKAQAWLGSQDPDAQTYLSAAQYLADHSAGVFGGRGQYITEALHSLTDPHSNPAAVSAALDEAERTAQGFVKAGKVHGRPSAPAGNQPGAPGAPTPAAPATAPSSSDFDPTKEFHPHIAR